MNGTWIPAITIGGGGTRAERTPDDEAAWVARVRAISARADAALIAHGAKPGDLVRPLCRPTDSMINAARTHFCALTPEQYEAMRPAARSDSPTPGTLLDLWEGASVSESGRVRCFDEFVPIAEIVWPEEKT
jgi:hypothetical protein